MTIDSRYPKLSAFPSSITSRPSDCAFSLMRAATPGSPQPFRIETRVNNTGTGAAWAVPGIETTGSTAFSTWNRGQMKATRKKAPARLPRSHNALSRTGSGDENDASGMATNQAEVVHKVKQKRYLRTIRRSCPGASKQVPRGSGSEQPQADADDEIERRYCGKRSRATVGDQGSLANGMIHTVHICILVHMVSDVKISFWGNHDTWCSVPEIDRQKNRDAEAPGSQGA